ncbi:DUF397 domain-containing protein [Nocardiopsis coralliicola]
MPDWRTSSYSQGHGGECVEVADTPDQVKVRDTQNRAAGHLSVVPGEWTAFLQSIKHTAL